MMKRVLSSTLVLTLMSSYGYATDRAMTIETADEAALITIVESVGAFADRGEFDALARLYADEFTLDYSSLNQQEAAVRRPLQLMAEWASVLPGFDRTRHALSDIEVEISNNTAAATANVIAPHWIGDDFWQVSGHYDYQFVQVEHQWKITSMTFTLKDEQGSRDVFGPAIANAGVETLPGHTLAIAAQNKKTVRTFFKHLENENISAFVELFAEDGVQSNPYHAGIFPAGANGKQALSDYWSPIPDQFDGMTFIIDELLATEDPNIVFARYRGAIKLKDNAGTYSNNYYSTFRFDREGKITEYVEIFDPIVAARGFGLLNQLK